MEMKIAIAIVVVAAIIMWLLGRYIEKVNRDGVNRPSSSANLITTSTGIRIADIGEQTQYPDRSYEIPGVNEELD